MEDELSNRCLFGTDWPAERTTVACKMNMIVHGDGSAGIVNTPIPPGLSMLRGTIEESTFDLCITKVRRLAPARTTPRHTEPTTISEGGKSRRIERSSQSRRNAP